MRVAVRARVLAKVDVFFTLQFGSTLGFFPLGSFFRPLRHFAFSRGPFGFFSDCTNHFATPLVIITD